MVKGGSRGGRGAGVMAGVRGGEGRGARRYGGGGDGCGGGLKVDAGEGEGGGEGACMRMPGGERGCAWGRVHCPGASRGGDAGADARLLGKSAEAGAQLRTEGRAGRGSAFGHRQRKGARVRGHVRDVRPFQVAPSFRHRGFPPGVFEGPGRTVSKTGARAGGGPSPGTTAERGCVCVGAVPSPTRAAQARSTMGWLDFP